MKSYVFIKNALIMTVTALILRSAGIVLKVWLANRIGSEGIGLYQLVFSVYALAATFATSGICTAVTRLVSENGGSGRKGVRTIMVKSIVLTLIIALFSAFIVYFLSGQIAVIFLKDKRAVLSLKALSFSLPFMGIASCFRGYFIAVRKTGAPSFSQIVEQAVRIGIIIFMLPRVESSGLGYSVSVVLWADTVSEVVSTVLLYLFYLKDKRKIKNQGQRVTGVFREIRHIALPVSGGKYVTTALRTVENLTVPSRLAIFNSSRTLSLSQFGTLRGMVIPIIFFPSTFLMSVSTLLIPEISEAVSQNHKLTVKHKSSRAVDITLCSSIFLAMVFFVCADGIGNIIYHDKTVGYMIRILSPVIPFMYLESVVDGMIKGLDQQKYSFWYNVSESVIRIVLLYFALPITGINGFLIIMIISNFTTCMLNFKRAKKVADISVDVKNSVIKPLFAAALGGVLASPFKELLFGFGEKAYSAVQIAVITLVFFITMFLTKGFSFRRTEKLSYVKI